LSLAPAAFCSSFRTACERLLDTRMADGVTRPGFFPQLAHRLGARSFDFDTPDLRMSTLLASDSDLGHAFSDAWALLREEVDGVVDVTRSPGLLSHPAETVPAQHRMQHAITAQREAAAARRLDVLMLALPRTDPRRHAWLEAGDHYRVDAGPNTARKRARDTMAPLNNKTQASTYPLIPHREFPTVVTDYT
jgi:hypothetical protein